MLAKLAMAGTLGVLALGGIAIAQEQPNTDPSALNKGVPTGTYDTWVPHGIAKTEVRSHELTIILGYSLIATLLLMVIVVAFGGPGVSPEDLASMSSFP